MNIISLIWQTSHPMNPLMITYADYVSTVFELDETDDSSDCEYCYTVKMTLGKQWFTGVNMAINDASQDVNCQLDSRSTFLDFSSTAF